MHRGGAAQCDNERRHRQCADGRRTCPRNLRERGARMPNARSPCKTSSGRAGGSAPACGGGLRWWPARCGGSRPTAHNQTNTITMGVQHARSSAESFALCKTPRAVKPRRGHKTWQRRGVASFLERALMQVPAATRARVRPMTDLRLWRQIVPGGNLALRQRRCQGKQHPTLALAEAQGNGGRHDEIRRRQAGRRDAGEQRCRLDAHA